MFYRLLACLMAISVWSAEAWSADRRFTLVIDAGHGGHDTGAIGAISKEKDINLRVALAFGKYVENGCPDVKVIYTRKTDVFVSLMNRANIANRNGADLFISIHTNALAKGKIARGFETYTLGMHRARTTWMWPCERTLSFPWRKAISRLMRASTPSLPKAISCLSSCRTRTWRKAWNWPA